MIREDLKSEINGDGPCTSPVFQGKAHVVPASLIRLQRSVCLGLCKEEGWLSFCHASQVSSNWTFSVLPKQKSTQIVTCLVSSQGV